jgi:hypothetical protein
MVLRDGGRLDLGDFWMKKAQFERLRPLLPDEVRVFGGPTTGG